MDSTLRQWYHFTQGDTMSSKKLYQLSKDETILWREICQERNLSIEHAPPDCSYKWRWSWMSKMLQYKPGITGVATQIGSELLTDYIYTGELKGGHKHGYGECSWNSGEFVYRKLA